MSEGAKHEYPIVCRLATSFVPVALNLYEIREAQDAGGELFRHIRRQKPQYQGIWIVAPDGQVLAAHHDVQDRAQWPQEVLAVIDVRPIRGLRFVRRRWRSGRVERAGSRLGKILPRHFRHQRPEPPFGPRPDRQPLARESCCD